MSLRHKGIAGTALPAATAAAAWPPAIPNAATGSAFPAGSFAGRLLPHPPVPGVWQQGQGRDREGTGRLGQLPHPAPPTHSSLLLQINQVSNAAGLIPHNCVLWASLPNPGVLQPEGMEVPALLCPALREQSSVLLTQLFPFPLCPEEFWQLQVQGQSWACLGFCFGQVWSCCPKRNKITTKKPQTKQRTKLEKHQPKIQKLWGSDLRTACFGNSDLEAWPLRMVGAVVCLIPVLRMVGAVVCRTLVMEAQCCLNSSQ